jgi:Sortase domain
MINKYNIFLSILLTLSLIMFGNQYYNVQSSQYTLSKVNTLFDDPNLLLTKLTALQTSEKSNPVELKNKLLPNIFDTDGKKLTQLLYSINSAYKMGFLSTENLKRLNIALPTNLQSDISNELPVEVKSGDSIQNLVPAPIDCEKRSTLSYPQYKIEAPIQYLSYSDMFGLNSDGSVNFNEDPVFENHPIYGDINSPIQKKLELGVVHLTTISPLPGEVGNSYIVGHSSNWGFIKSDYNTVFKPIERTSKSGEEFYIYDDMCRKLKFKVFESLEIEDSNVMEAYKNFGDKRVVTLQGSIVSYRPEGGVQPYQRWLTRGELVLE